MVKIEKAAFKKRHYNDDIGAFMKHNIISTRNNIVYMTKEQRKERENNRSNFLLNLQFIFISIQFIMMLLLLPFYFFKIKHKLPTNKYTEDFVQMINKLNDWEKVLEKSSKYSSPKFPRYNL